MSSYPTLRRTERTTVLGLRDESEEPPVRRAVPVWHIRVCRVTHACRRADRDCADLEGVEVREVARVQARDYWAAMDSPEVRAVPLRAGEWISIEREGGTGHWRRG